LAIGEFGAIFGAVLKRDRSSAPESLVTRGRFNFGTFDGPIAHVEPMEAKRPFGLPVPRAVRAWRLKEWQAVQIVHERYFILLALFDAKTLAIAQAKVYDRSTRKKFVFERQLPTWKIQVARGLMHSRSHYRGRGCELTFDNRLAQGHLDIHVDLPAAGDFPGLSGSVTGQIAGNDPLVVSIPFADNRGMYSHKGPFTVDGTLRLGSDEIQLERSKSLLLLDDHKGFYPVEMKWDWVTCAGRDEAGRLLALNLTRNQSIDPARYNENCLWIDGKAHLLGPVRFEREGCSEGDRWTIRDDEGRVDVGFEVEVEGRVDINVLLLRSDYYGPFGRFSGHVVADDASTVSLEGLFGMGERFYLRC